MILAGLVVNMHYGLVSRLLPATTGLIVAVLARCLSQDIAALLAASKLGEASMAEEGPEEEVNAGRSSTTPAN